MNIMIVLHADLDQNAGGEWQKARQNKIEAKGQKGQGGRAGLGWRRLWAKGWLTGWWLVADGWWLVAGWRA